MFTFDPNSREVDNDPYPLYRRLRDVSSVTFRSPVSPDLAFTRH